MSEQKTVVVIGSGPAGYTAATYLARAGLAPVVFAGDEAGGQLMWTTVVENFPGFEKGIDGPQLMEQMRAQAVRFGAQIESRVVARVDFSDPAHKRLYIKKRGEEIEYEADAVVIATGASSIRLGVEGEDRLFGRGVATCAVCDAAFYKEKHAVVIGGGDSAMEDTLALTKFAAKVTVIHRRDQFKASKIMQQRVLEHPKVHVLWNTQVKAVLGEEKLTAIRILQNGKEQEFSADGMFLAIGHRPTVDFLSQQVQLDAHGYIVTRMSHTALGVKAAEAALSDHGVEFPSMTSVEGVFAAGDVVDVRYKQAITSAAQGCAAAIDVEKWLESRE